jgi:hypothetical protein
MDGTRSSARLLQAGLDLQEAANVAGRDEIGVGLPNAFHFPRQESVRHLGLKHVVRSGAATTEIRLGQFDEAQPRDLRQDGPRLAADPLRVREMAGLVVGHRHRHGAQLSIPADVGQDLGDIADLRAEPCGEIGRASCRERV